MAGKFEIYTDKAGKFRFRLKAGNGPQPSRAPKPSSAPPRAQRSTT